MVGTKQSKSIMEQLFHMLLMEKLTIPELLELIVMALLLQVELSKGLMDTVKCLSMRLCSA